MQSRKDLIRNRAFLCVLASLRLCGESLFPINRSRSPEFRAWRALLSGLGCAILLLATNGALLAQGDLLEAVDGLVGRLETVFDHPVAPEVSVEDLYGNPLTLSQYGGRVVLMSFVDQKSGEEARAWLSEQSIDFLGDPRIAFVNVLYPGRIPFVVSRSDASENIRAEIDRFLERVWQGLPEANRERFQRTTIRWAVDWNRELQRLFNATRDRMTLVVIDGSGRIRRVIRSKTPETVKELAQLVAELEAEAAVSGAANPEG